MPPKKAARELLGYPHPRRVPRGVYAEQAIGISTDEFTRAKDSGLRFLRNVFPLLDPGFDRARRVEFLAERGSGATMKSACVGCPMWNLSWLPCQLMITVRWERYPLVDQHLDAHRWLQFLANIGRAANTIDAYRRAVEDHLRFCMLAGVEPLTIRADAVAAWIGDMFAGHRSESNCLRWALAWYRRLRTSRDTPPARPAARPTDSGSTGRPYGSTRPARGSDTNPTRTTAPRRGRPATGPGRGRPVRDRHRASGRTSP